MCLPNYLKLLLQVSSCIQTSIYDGLCLYLKMIILLAKIGIYVIKADRRVSSQLMEG